MIDCAKDDSAHANRIDASDSLCALIEALIFASGSPVSAGKLASAAGCSEKKAREAACELKERLAAGGSGIELVEVNGGYQLRTRAQFGDHIKALRVDRPRRLSPAALETLAVIAYRQPIVKADIETIRGVDATPTIKTLLGRRVIKIVGHKAVAGQPALYGTTDRFLEMFGLKSLAELPSLRDLKDLSEEPGEIEAPEESDRPFPDDTDQSDKDSVPGIA